MHVHTPLAFLGRHLAPHYGDEGPQERRLAWNLVFGGDEVLAHHFDQLTLLVRARACPHGGIRDAKCAAVSAKKSLGLRQILWRMFWTCNGFAGQSQTITIGGLGCEFN